MPKIKITNPRNVIEAPIKKNYFKIRATSGPKGDKGDTGATGPQGPQGPQGNAATIYVGSTTTLPVGQDATVENVGSQYAAVLNFGIPQGPQGPQGAKGDKGDKGDKGEQGNTGNTGPAGQNATVYIGTTTTGAPGSQASVYNSGTENNAVLNFTIPRGQKGDTGATGPQGPAGQDGKDFAPSVVDSLPAVGEESKLYLTPKAHTTQTATGNPITATITDGAGQIESFQLDGDTYQQSYTGKNLVNLMNMTASGVSSANNGDGTVTITGTASESSSIAIMNASREIEAGTYTLTISKELPFTINLSYRGVSFRIAAGSTSATATATGNFANGNLWMVITGGTTYNETFGIQLTRGSAPDTNFEPFVGGGIPAPNPSYPQPIQVVTGSQTVAINGTDYPLDLGTIELCKLGTYQDYIYKDGDTWKVHKAIATYTFDDSLLSWQKNTQISGGYVMSYNVNSPLYGVLATGTPSYSSKCTHFTIRNDSTTWTGVGKAGFNSVGAFWCMTNIANLDDFLEWLGEDNPELFYPLATATDTEITDTTLISQLNTIASASLENGSNTITNTATGSNLAGDMEVDYFGYDPTNRYDKWLWLDINNAYEKLGS